MRKNVILGAGAVCFIVVFAFMTFGAVAIQQFSSENTNTEKTTTEKPDIESTRGPSEALNEEQDCSGVARCVSGIVTKVIDGDTIEVDGHSIRFALVDTPEYGEKGYTQARNYVETICPVGSAALVDEDDLQTEGSHGRIIGVIYCNNLNLNEQVLSVGHAEILTSFCLKSEFAGEQWVQKFGC